MFIIANRLFQVLSNARLFLENIIKWVEMRQESDSGVP